MDSLGRILGVTVVAACLSGCASYRLGPTIGVENGQRSIEIAPFSNETPEPRAGAVITSAMRKSLGRDGTYRLETRGHGEIYVTGVVTQFDREAVSYQPNDILTARDFRLRVIAKITAIDRSTGKTILNREVEGRTSLRIGGDLPSAERQAMPLMAEDLARNATSLLVDGTW